MRHDRTRNLQTKLIFVSRNSLCLHVYTSCLQENLKKKLWSPSLKLLSPAKDLFSNFTWAFLFTGYGLRGTAQSECSQWYCNSAVRGQRLLHLRSQHEVVHKTPKECYRSKRVNSPPVAHLQIMTQF